VKNSNLCLFLRRRAKFGGDWTPAAELLHIFDFKNGSHPPSWIFIFSQFLKKKIKFAPLSSS